MVILAICCLAPGPASRPIYVTASDFDFQKLLGDPPADDSQEHRDEVDRMLALQAARTPEEVQRCQDEVAVSEFSFSKILGAWFNRVDLPLTARILDEANAQGKAVTDGAKKKWARVRPPIADPRIKPCVRMENTGSYPSGHAMRGMVWATLLSDMFPEHRDALMVFGKRVGDDRFLAGMHYPSDVVAGQKLGAEIAKRMLADDAFKAELEKAKAECRADVKKAA
jgi:acid phosphatase (class A)